MGQAVEFAPEPLRVTRIGLRERVGAILDAERAEEVRLADRAPNAEACIPRPAPDACRIPLRRHVRLTGCIERIDLLMALQRLQRIGALGRDVTVIYEQRASRRGVQAAL